MIPPGTHPFALPLSVVRTRDLERCVGAREPTHRATWPDGRVAQRCAIHLCNGVRMMSTARSQMCVCMRMPLRLCMRVVMRLAQRLTRESATPRVQYLLKECGIHVAQHGVNHVVVRM